MVHDLIQNAKHLPCREPCMEPWAHVACAAVWNWNITVTQSQGTWLQGKGKLLSENTRDHNPSLLPADWASVKKIHSET